MSVNFFDSIYYPRHRNLTWSEFFLEKADSYFALPWTRKMCVLPSCTQGGAQGVMLKSYPTSKIKTILKVASLFTIIVPLVMLPIKLATRHTHRFYLIDSDVAATQIQKNIRGWIAKKSFDRKRKAAICIQKIYRGHREKQIFQKKKEAAVVIQKNCRRYLAKQVFEKQKKAANIIQRNYRRHRAQLVFQHLRQERDYEKLCSVVFSSGRCGSKHDNLLRIRSSLSSEIALVPAFFGFTDEQIKSYFSPETYRLWDQTKSETNESRQGELLRSVEKNVKEDILSVDFLKLTPEQKTALNGLKGKTLIVRSSSNEDGRIVNAGGNKTVGGILNTERLLKQALAEVVASYFGYRSFKNRSPFENPFAHMPLCSVLVMEQVTEDDHPLVSGVMMTHKPNWSSDQEGRIAQISASWGFGEGVVSTQKGIAADEWIITEMGIYETIRRKTHRLVVLPGGSTKEVVNDSSLQEKRVLEERHLEKLQIVANRLEETFGCHLDIEFVIREDVIYIVQARPIQVPEMKDPTFLDPETIPQNGIKFYGKAVVSGENRLMSVSGKSLLFASNLDEADEKFSSKHQAVIIYETPKVSNSHAAVNFSSARTPIPCMVLSYEDWKNCRSLWKDLGCYNLCPQTGVIVFAESYIPPRSGLIIHSASNPISVDLQSMSIQATVPNESIQEITRLLITTPERLAVNLDEIDEKIARIFAHILHSKVQTSAVRKVAISLHGSVTSTLNIMHKCRESKAPSHLSLHAGMLKQMLEQTAKGIVGAHSLAGIQAATYLPLFIKVFMESHVESEIICDLAACGRNAFDENLQRKWIIFLQDNLQAPPEKLERLLHIVQELDAIHMDTLWFAVYFSGETPSIDTLIQESKTREFLLSVLEFDVRVQNLTDQSEKIGSKENLYDSWTALQAFSQDFLKFVSKHHQRSFFHNLYLSKIFVDVIQLWDLNIKTVRSFRLLSEEETDSLFKDRITQFALFGLECRKSRLINQNYEEVMFDMVRPISRASSSKKTFSLEHWLVPLSPVYRAIENEDQRLTVIHQNLLQAAQPAFSSTLATLLPRTLRRALQLFEKYNKPDLVKRFAENIGTFVAFSSEKASVRINVPLNYHSFVATISQNRGSDSLEVIAYWRGSDNWQGSHKDFLHLLCTLTGIGFEGHTIKGSDLKVVFSVHNEDHMRVLCKAILSVNWMSLHIKSYFRTLVQLICPKKLSNEPKEIRDQINQETEYKIFDAVWSEFLVTNEMSSVIRERFQNPSPSVRQYFTERGLLPQIQAQVVAELKADKSGVFVKNFLRFMKKIAPQEIKEAIWYNLTHSQTIWPFEIHKSYRKAFLMRLFTEFPSEALAYCKKHKYFVEYFEPVIEEMVSTGSPKSAYEAELIALIAKKMRNAPDAWREALQCWELAQV